MFASRQSKIQNPKSQIRASLLAIAFLALLGARPLPAGEGLERDIAAVIEDPEFKHAHWGILVVDAKTGSTIYERNPDRLFAPASVTKIFTVSSALDAFGADYRFETPVYARGEISPLGELAGDLILVASGDLTLGGRTTTDGQIAFTNNDHTYANGGTKGQLTDQDPLAGLNELARQVAASGIRRVRGEILIDDRLFEKEVGSGSGPKRVTPIMVNDNLIDLTISPTLPGKPAEVTRRPRSSAFLIDARVDTVAEGGPLTMTIRGVDSHSITVRGTIPAGHQPVVRVYEVPDAALFARALFIEALGRAGVDVAASPLGLANSPPSLPGREEYAKLKPAAKLVSLPFSENVRLVLKVSHNLHASTLPLLVAAKNGERTLAAGLKRERDFLKRAGVAADTISFGGGAGGSPSDFVTPRATVDLLRAMQGRPDADVFRRALPILGIDGTLADSVPVESKARGKFQAKTGTLYWENGLSGGVLLTSKALAGYATTAKDRPIAFALFVNNVHLPSASEGGRIGKTLGKVCEAIYANE